MSPTKVAPGFDHTRSALGASLVPDGAPKRAVRRTPGRRSPRLARSTTDTGFPGARFWGQVRGSSGRLRIVQGKGGTSGETSQIAGKARYQAPFPGHIAAGRILHGKEGVDGSSPSEGFSISLQIRCFCLLRCRRVWVSTSTERPPPWDAPSRWFGATSTQRPLPARARVRRAGRRRGRDAQ